MYVCFVFIVIIFVDPLISLLKLDILVCVYYDNVILFVPLKPACMHQRHQLLILHKCSYITIWHWWLCASAKAW